MRYSIRSRWFIVAFPLCATLCTLSRSERELRVAAEGQIRPRTKWPDERIEADVLRLQLDVAARLINDRRRNFVVELQMIMSDSKDSRDCE